MSSIAVRMAFLMAVLPGAIGLICVGGAWLLARREGGRWKQRVSRALPGAGIGAALAISGFMIQGLPAKAPFVLEWPPFGGLAAKEWSLVLISVAAVLALFESVPGRAPRVFIRWVGRALIGAGLLGLLMKSAFEYQIGSGQAPLWIGGLSAGMAAWWWFADVIATRAKGVSMPIVMQVVSGSAAGLMFLAGAVGQSNIAGVLAAAFGGAMVAGVVFRSGVLTPGAMTVAGTALWSVLMVGYFFGEEGAIPPLAAVLIAVSVVGAGAGELPLIRKRAGWQRLIVRLIAVGALAGGAVGLTAMNAPAETDDPYDYYSDPG